MAAAVAALAAKAAVDLGAIVRQVADSLQTLARDRDVEVTADLLEAACPAYGVSAATQVAGQIIATKLNGRNKTAT